MSNLGIALNTKTMAASQYGDLSFNSLCNVNGTLVASNSSGIFEFGATTDNGTAISGIFKTGRYDLGTPKPKHIRTVKMGGYIEGHCTTTVVGPGTTSNESWDKANPAVLRNEGYTTIDTTGSFFNVQIQNIDGAYFRIDTLDVKAYLMVNDDKTTEVSCKIKKSAPMPTISATAS